MTETRWETLSGRLTTFDDELVRAGVHGRMLLVETDEPYVYEREMVGFAAMTWVSPATDAAKEHVEFLEKAYEHLKDGAAHFGDVAQDVKRAAAHTATQALDLGIGLAKDVAEGLLKANPATAPFAAAYDAADVADWVARSDAVQEKMKALREDVAPIAGAFGAAVALGAILWPALAVFILYELFLKRGSRAKVAA